MPLIGRFNSEKQKEAWAPTALDYQAWRSRLVLKQPMLDLIGGKVGGFIELDYCHGYLDCCYTHPRHQSKGVASAL